MCTNLQICMQGFRKAPCGYVKSSKIYQKLKIDLSEAACCSSKKLIFFKAKFIFLNLDWSEDAYNFINKIIVIYLQLHVCLSELWLRSQRQINTLVLFKYV